MTDERATLIISIEDQLSRGANLMVKSLDRLSVATGYQTKENAKLEASLASLSASMGKSAAIQNASSSSLRNAETRLTGARNAAQKYAAVLDSMKRNSAGQLINAQTGQFASNAQIAQYNKAAMALEGIRKQTAALAAEAAKPMKAALPTGYASFLERQKASLTTASTYTPTGAVPINLGNNSKLINGAVSDMDRLTSAASRAAGATSNILPPSARYALYDTSRNVTILGAALVALAAIPAKVAIDFDREFANVRRTVRGAGDETKSSLIELSNTIPVSFKSITAIAALGGQLGIGLTQIVDFTSTVAKLTATTNLSADAAGTALGRFQSLFHLNTSDFNRLGSAILKVGVNSVATETQIAQIGTQIAGIGRFAGYTVPQVIGLSGALASIGIAPELARGTVTRIFSQINSAVAEGGTKLQEFSKIAGVSATEFSSAFGTDKFSGVFDKFVAGLSDTTRTGGNAVIALQQLGITSVRDIPLLLRLSQAQQVLTKANQDAADGWKRGTELNDQYGKIASTTSAKLQVLGNNFVSFMNAVGQGTVGPVGSAVDVLTGFLSTLNDISKNPISSWALALGGSLAVVLGVIALLAGAGLRGAAGILGLMQSLRALHVEGMEGVGIRATMIAQLNGLGAAGKVASFGLRAAGTAMAALAAIGIVAAVAQGAGALIKLGDAASGVHVKMEKLVKGGKAAATELSRVISTGGQQNSGSFGYKNPTQDIAVRTTGVNGAFSQKGSALKGINDFFGGIAGNLSGLTQAREVVDKIDGALAKMVKNGYADQAAAAFGHLLAKASEGNTVNLSDFSKQFVEYNKALKEHQEVAAAAQRANEGLQNGLAKSVNITKTIADLTGLDTKAQGQFADAYAKSVQPLTDFNSIVGQVQTGLQNAADAQAKAAGGSAQATDFYNGTAVSLAQFTAQLVTNNDAQQTWAANLLTVAATYGPAAAQQFIQAGYTAVNASILQQLVDASPAQAQAYIDAQTEAASLAGQATANALLASGHIVDSAGHAIGQSTANKLAEGLRLGLPVEYLMQQLNLRFRGNPIEPAVDTGGAINALDSIIRSYDGRVLHMTVHVTDQTGAPVNKSTAGVNNLYATGGYTGPGAKYQARGIVHAGEFVFTKEATSRIGPSTLYAIMNGRSGASSIPHYSYATGGEVNLPTALTSGQVSLSAADRSLLLLIARRVGLSIDGTALVETASAVNLNNGRRRKH